MSKALLAAVFLFSGSEAHARSRAVRALTHTRAREVARRPNYESGARTPTRPAAAMSSTAPEPIRREPAGEILRRVFGGALAASAGCALVVASGHELATKLTADVLSGCLAALAVSPFVALVDSAVARSVANKSPPQRELWQSIVALVQAPSSCLYRTDFYYTYAPSAASSPASRAALFARGASLTAPSPAPARSPCSPP